MEKYIPISCSFVDRIEHYATLREEVLFKYRLGSEEFSLRTKIKTTEVKDGEEFIILEKDGLRIRMDNIISINEHVLNHAPKC